MKKWFFWLVILLLLGYGYAQHKQKVINGKSPFIYSLGISLILECAQTLFSIGRFDIDDLILNSSGGLIGFITFKLFAKVVTTSSVIQAGGRFF